MAKPNTTFNLDVKDLELIEDALHSVIAKRSNDLITASDAQNSTVDRASAEAEMSEMRDLLGRLHNQKNWFRPKTGPQLHRRLTLVFVTRRPAAMRFEIQRYMQRVMRTLGTMVAFAGLAIQADWGRVLIKTVPAFIKIGNVVCEL